MRLAPAKYIRILSVLSKSTVLSICDSRDEAQVQRDATAPDAASQQPSMQTHPAHAAVTVSPAIT